MRHALDAWVALWAEREHPRSLGLVRVGVGAVLLWDLLDVARLGLVLPFWAPQQAGGWLDLISADAPLYHHLPPEPWVARAYHGLMVLAAGALTAGLGTRVAAAALLLLSALHAEMVPLASRAVDLLARDALFVLALSGAGAWGGVDAWRRTGSWWGDGQLVAAWPRYLLIGQLVLMYASAGLQKTGAAWWPAGDLAALFIVLQDPAIARVDFGWLRAPWAWRLTQLGTVVTVAWQLLYPLVLLWLFYARTPDRPGALRRLSNRLHLERVWIGVGVMFHLVLAATTDLGVFPWLMLALYPCLVSPRSAPCR